MANGNSFFGLLTGLAAGAVLGLLYAPDKGWKTRERVKRAAANGWDEVKENLDGFGEKFDEKTASAKEGFNSLKDTILEQGAELKDSAKRKILEQLDKLEKKLTESEGGVDDQTEGEA